MNSVLPWSDPQFWIASGAVATVAAVALWRALRPGRAAELPCARCPQAAAHGRAAASAGGPAVAGSRRLPIVASGPGTAGVPPRPPAPRR